VLQLIAAGGNAYYLAKFAGIFGLDMQDIGAQQTGMTKDEFKAKLVAAARKARKAQTWPHHRWHHHLARARHRPRHRPQGLQQDPYWKPFFDGFRPVRAGWPRTKPDVVVVFYNDHGLNFFLDKMPTFAVGAAPEYRNADEGWGIPGAALQGRPDLSWHLIESLVGEEFDLTTCQEMLVDHAFTLPMALLWPDQAWPVRWCRCASTPCSSRCPARRAATSWARPSAAPWRAGPGDEKVVVLGTGGLSHQLDGERAGFINKDFDLQFMDSLVGDPSWATQFSIHRAGGEGRHPGRRAADVAGHARRAGRQGAGAAPQLPHPDLQHRLKLWQP
jgi:protocatechuate 4,5-dioxygenase beta chain